MYAAHRYSQEALAEKMDGVRWHGRYFSARCPYHDDREPSLLVYADGAYCLGCHRRVTLAALTQKVERPGEPRSIYLDPRQPQLLKWQHLPPTDTLVEEAHRLLMSSQKLQEYFVQRGVESRMEINRLGWFDGFYIFPIFSPELDILSFIARADPHTEAANPGVRYLVPPGQAAYLYVPDWPRILRAKKVLMVFGVFDALSLAVLGYPVVSPARGYTVSNYSLRLIPQPLVLLPDAQPPEEYESAWGLAKQIGWRAQVRQLEYPPGYKDPNDLFRSSLYRTNLVSQIERL